MKKSLISAFMTMVVLFGYSANAQQNEPRLWCADARTYKVYEITMEGSLIRSFRAPEGATSGLTFDPTSDTLWGVSEDRPKAIVNFDKLGKELSLISSDQYAAGMSVTETPEGVSVDPFDNTLWVVHDNDLPTGSVIYHIKRDGSLIDSFPASRFDLQATSAQEIAVDLFDGTLWITDNNTWPVGTVYHVTRTGHLIGSFATIFGNDKVKNVQGIAVDGLDGTLWITARDTQKIYNVTTEGSWVSEFSSTRYDPSSKNPTAITMACMAPNTVPTVSISTPSDGGVFPAFEAIGFSGSATDAEDGDLTGDLSWNSDVDGPIGSGGSFSALLSVGTHVITATVTDSKGLSASAQVSIIVNTPPSTVSLIFNEGFAATRYDETSAGIGSNWVEKNAGGGTLNPDFAVSSVESATGLSLPDWGNQCAKLAGGTSYVQIRNILDAGYQEMYLRFEVIFGDASNLPNSSSYYVMYLTDSSYTIYMGLLIGKDKNGNLKLQTKIENSGGDIFIPGSLYSAAINTKYTVEFHYVGKGICEVKINGITIGTGATTTASVDRILLYNGSNTTVYYDNVQISTEGWIGSGGQE